MQSIIGYNQDEIVGYDGDDWDALAGDQAAIGARGRGGFGAQMGRARQIDPNAVAVMPRQLNNRRRKVLAAPGLTLAAGATGAMVFKTQELFRPERLVVAAASGALTITGISVGTQSQLASNGDVPAEVFGPTAVDVDVHFMTANVGNDITITFRNNTAGPLDARACFIGTSIS